MIKSSPALQANPQFEAQQFRLFPRSDSGIFGPNPTGGETMRTFVKTLPILFCVCFAAAQSDKKDDRLTAELLFQWEQVSDPQISPDGTKIIYVRRWPDVMADKRFSNLWIINFDGSDNRPLTNGKYSESSPRWSPDGK